MTPIYENYRSETPVCFHYDTGSKNYQNSLFGHKLLATTVCSFKYCSEHSKKAFLYFPCTGSTNMMYVPCSILDYLRKQLIKHINVMLSIAQILKCFK